MFQFIDTPQGIEHNMIQLKGTPVKMYSTGDISIQNTPRSASNFSIDPNKRPAAPHIFEHLTGLI